MKRARDLLPAVLGSAADSAERNQDWVFAFWVSAVGDSVASRARPRALRGRLLIVEVDGLDWINQLEPLRERIRRELNAVAQRDLVGRIVFRPAQPERRPPAVASESHPPSRDGVDPMRRRAYRASKAQGE